MSAIQRLKRAGLSSDVWSADPSTGLYTQNGPLIETGVLTPASFSGTENDYNPAGLATAYHLRLASTTSSALTGIAGGVDGRKMRLSNVGAFNIAFTNDSTSSAANRFLTPRALPFFLYPGQDADIWYDALSARWRIFGYTARTVTGAITVPTLAAGVLGYVDTVFAASTFPIDVGDFLIAYSDSDVATAGVGNGGFLNARVIAPNTVRACFRGATTTNSRTFRFTFRII